MGFAAGYDDIPFAHSFNTDFAKTLEITHKYGLVVFRTFDEGHKFLLDESSLDADKMK